MTKRSANEEAIQLLETARRLAQRNRWQQRDGRFFTIVVTAVVVAVVALVWFANAYSTSITDGVALALRFPVLIVVLVGWIATSVAARQRSQSRRDAERSWLAALPVGEKAFAADAGRRIAMILGVAVLTALALLLTLSWLVALPTRLTATLSLLLIMGATLGAVTGWALARKAPRPLRIRLPASVTGIKAQRCAVGRWPLRHSRAHADLALHARAIGVLLLSLPIGVPPEAVVAMIVFGLSGLAIWDTSRALLTTTRMAGGWMRSLPFDPRKATLALGGRSVFVITIAAAIMLVATAVPTGVSIGHAGVIIVAIGLAVACGYVIVATMQRPFRAR